MEQILLINQIFVFLNVALGCFLAFWVFLANPREKLNQIFFIMTILMVLMVVFAFLGFFSREIQKALIWYRLNGGMVALFFIASYFFSIYFPKKITESRFLTKFVVVLCFLIFLISVFSDLIISGVAEKEWGMEIIFGKGKLFYYIPIIFLTLLILYNLFKKYFVLTKQERLKIQYVLVGIFIFALANLIFNIGFTFLTNSIQFSHFADYSTIFFLGFTAYAIVKRELFGIKVVLTALLVGMIAVLLALDVFVFTQNLSLQLVKGIILVVFLYFGYLLIRSVLIEIKRREELENLTSQLEVTNIKLTSAYKKMEKLDKAKSEFISIASHQLKTPLSAIKGYLSMVLEKSYGKPPKKMERPLENVYASNERLIKLVDNLLNISKIETGKIELDLEEASIEEIISGAIDELKITAEKKNIYLKFEKPEKSLPKIIIDKEKIREVIMNIIDNAIRYTEKGGVTIKCKTQDEKCKIEITDTGEGMTKEEISKLFESFSRGTAGTRFWTGGAGLGLYIAKKFVEMHKGRIFAESKGKNKGSSFYIEIPIKQNL